MCVIMLVNKTRPTDEMVNRAWDHNKDGAGFAWREKRDGKVEVVWKKGIETVEEARELARTLPTPYVAHFRVASVGGVRRSLTHPFPVGADAILDLEGRTEGSLLFHNGHWSNWAEKALDAAIASNTQIPVGDWSDTRAMAWMVNIYGPGFMEFLPSQKGIIMTPANTGIFTGNGWDKINEVWCSNDYFWKGRHTTVYHGRICTHGRCKNQAQVGKGLCSSCEANAGSDDKEDHTKPITSLALIVGTEKRPLGRVLSLNEAEDIYKNKGMSKNKIKRFQKLYSNLPSASGNRKNRIVKELETLSEDVAEQLVNGSIH